MLLAQRNTLQGEQLCLLAARVTGTDLTMRSAGRLYVLLSYLLLTWISEVDLSITKL